MKKEIQGSFSIDQNDILGIEDGEIMYIKGHIYSDENEDSINCVIAIGVDNYKYSIDRLIDLKRDFCERYDHWCGASYICFDGELSSHEIILNDFDIDSEEIIQVKTPLVYCNRVEVDMEHG